MELWYFTSKGTSHGPVSPQQLRDAARAGHIQPADLVWKQGMAEWVPASRIKGLFLMTSAPPAPPPIPPEMPSPVGHFGGTSATTPPPPDWLQAIETPVQPVSARQANLGLAFWNPNAAANWSLLFSPIFGGFLVAKNWTAMGRNELASQSWIWVVLCSGLSFLLLFVPPFDGDFMTARLIGLGTLAGWYFMCARPQANFLAKNFGRSYRKQPLTPPLLIGAAVLGGYVLLASFVQMTLWSQPQASAQMAGSKTTPYALSDPSGQSVSSTQSIVSRRQGEIAPIGTLANETIVAAIGESTSLEFIETPFADVLGYLQDLHRIPFQVDPARLAAHGVNGDTPITINVKGITLADALRQVLGELGLTYRVEHGSILITAP